MKLALTVFSLFFFVLTLLNVDAWGPVLTGITEQMAYAITHTVPGHR